jgi:DNA-directed RNA polymerase subunit omega
MIYPAPDKLDALGSKYSLVIVAAKRARQIKEGARHLVDTKSANPLTIALEEVASDEIVPLMIGDPEAIVAPVSSSPVLGGLLATSLDDESPRGRTASEVSALLSADDDDFDDDDDEVDLDDEDEVDNDVVENAADDVDAEVVVTDFIEDDESDSVDDEDADDLEDEIGDEPVEEPVD